MTTVVRASQVSQYPDCPRRAAARMFSDEIRAAGFVLRADARGIGAGVGTAVHKAAAVMLDEKARTGELPPDSTASDAAVATLREYMAEGVLFDRETVTANDGELQAVRMSRAYRSQVAPMIEPMLVEGKLEAVVPWATQNIVLSGHADVIAREPGRVIDLKTGKRMGNHNGQLGSYSLLARSGGYDISEAAIDFVQRVPIKKPQPDPVRQRVRVELAEQIAANILRHIDTDLRTWRLGDIERRLQSGDPAAFLANPSSVLCSARWCRAHSCGPNGWCREYREEE